jgi:hypothetical protein
MELQQLILYCSREKDVEDLRRESNVFRLHDLLSGKLTSFG